MIVCGILFYPFNIVQLRYGYLSPIGMIATLGAIVLFLGGWRLVKYTWLPIAFLIFAVPLPRRYFVSLTMPMRHLAAAVATALLNLVSGMEATLPGQTLLVSGYTRTHPLRETIRACYDGTPEFPITVMGYSDPFYVTGSEDVSETAENCKWQPSQAGEEHFLTTDAGKVRLDNVVRVLATATKADWEKDGLDGVTQRALIITPAS